MLEFAEYLVTAAAVFVLLGLVSGIALVTSRRRNPVATVSVRAKVSVGGAALAPAQSEAPVQAGRGTSLGWYATAFQVIALLLLTAYMVIRMSLTGHGPFANQHEFAVAFTWGILLVNLFFGLRYRIRMLSLVVLPVAAAMLVYALSLDTGVRPLDPCPSEQPAADPARRVRDHRLRRRLRVLRRGRALPSPPAHHPRPPAAAGGP